jgi:HK97 family phage major capsid protein
MPTRKPTKLPGPPGIRYLPVTKVTKLEARAADGADAPARYEVAFSSEYQVTRSFWGETWREQLSHEPGAVDMGRFASGRAAVLLGHGGQPIGVIDEASVGQDKVGRAVIRFSRTQRGADAEIDFNDGVTPNISVGYIPKRAQLVETDEENGDLWRATLWEPVELSIVGVPADPTVGAGRDQNGDQIPPVEIEEGPTVTKERAMTKEEKEEQERIAAAAAAETTRKQRESATAAATLAEEARAKQINEILEPRGLAHMARDFILSTLAPEQVAARALEALKVHGTAQPAEESLASLGASAEEVKGYSYARAIMGLVDLAEGRQFSGFEADVHKELLKKVPKERALKGGVLVPTRLAPPSTRTLATTTGGKGAELLFEQPGELIEILRTRMAVILRGARLLTGLTAPIGFPKQTGAATAYWVGENPPADIPDSDLAFGLAQLAQKTLQASTSYTRQMLVQVSIDTEGLVRDDLAAVHARAGDKAAIHGLGANGEPTGIYKAAGVSAVAVGGAMSYAKLLAMKGAVAAQNADMGSLGWIMHSTMATNLEGILDFPASAAGRPIWTGTYLDGKVAGYPATASNQVSTTMTGSEVTGGAELGATFGNWADLIMGMFGAFELIIDPYRLKKRGIVEVTSFQMLDILARHGQSFVKSTGATG